MVRVAGLVIYECGICDMYHPWDWSGDCRDDDNRFFPDEYAQSMMCSESELVIRTMDERVASDNGIHCEVDDAECSGEVLNTINDLWVCETHNHVVIYRSPEATAEHLQTEADAMHDRLTNR